MLKVALVGFGTVGQSVARILCARPAAGLALTHIANRRVERKRVGWVPPDVIWTDDFEQVVGSDADVVVELIGGVDPAAEWIRRALAAGKSVVTANKQVIAQCGDGLLALARERRRHLLFEAAVAGGIPVVRGLREGLAGDRLVRVEGVLNGTCNYILTRMADAQVSFAAGLSEAQELGYAEADPSADLDGADAGAKLAILALVGLRRRIDVEAVPLASIREIDPIDFVYARRLGCTIRQVARAELLADERLLAFVRPALVPLTSNLARIEGNQNTVVVEGAFGGEASFSGAGAGGGPTAVSVVSDLEAIARAEAAGDTGWPTASSAEAVEREFEAPHYARFVVADRPGIIASLADVFSRHGVNVDAVLQEPGWSKSELPFVVTLERCSSAAVGDALTEIASFDFHARRPVWMPILASGGGPS